MRNTDPPLELPRQVMRRALAVALGGLLLTLLLGLWRVQADTRQELDAALALARATERLANLSAFDDVAVLHELEAVGQGLRHLRLTITDGEGRVRYQSPVEDEGWRDWLPGARRGDAAAAAPGAESAATPARQSVSWRVDRGGGRFWTVLFTTVPESEQDEALASLADLVLLMAVSCAAMLLVMRWNLRRAFRPLEPLLAAIARLERQDLAAVRALPTMPIRELESISAALKHLAQALQEAETARRVLAHQVLSLQEDERTRLAAELHDEFGQRLTALRVDAAWLARQLPEADPRRPVVDGMSGQITLIQQDVRGLLARLRPLAQDGEPASLARLQGLLASLVEGWSRPGARALGAELRLRHGPAPDAPLCNPARDAAWLHAVVLPRVLVLAVYRITQEALTNVARHAGATRAIVVLRAELDAAQPGVTGTLHWSVADDGSGHADLRGAMQQGSGLAGMQERVWALGGEFGTAADAEAARGGQDAMPPLAAADRLPGLVLQARLPFMVGTESQAAPGAAHSGPASATPDAAAAAPPPAREASR